MASRWNKIGTDKKEGRARLSERREDEGGREDEG
jgi:hypothetical protein